MMIIFVISVTSQIMINYYELILGLHGVNNIPSIPTVYRYNFGINIMNINGIFTLILLARKCVISNILFKST